ncbi:hypothetical protein M5689_011065 [Euphorbia peplus]|nr:hypothetical protein M5689_011065 [Euphorbia peplus]
MGRKVAAANNDPFHQTLSIPLFLAGMAAMMAIVSLLCGVRSRKKSESATEKPQEKNTNTNTNSPLSSPPTKSEEKTEAVIQIVEDSQREIESEKNYLATRRQIKDKISSTNLLLKSASTRNLAKNLSMKMTRSMSMAGRDLQDRMKKGKLKPEDSVWMKTIILGEKCKVTDGEEGAVIYERKGNKISAYHPKTSNSFIDQNPIPISQHALNDEPNDHFSQ